MNWGSVSDYLLFIITIIGIFIAYKQLNNLVDSVKTSQKNNAIQTVQLMLSIYKIITESKTNLEAHVIVLNDVKKRFENGDELTEQELLFQQLIMNIRIEDYLNSLDTLCSCLLKDNELEADYKSDYEKIVDAAFNNYSSNFEISQKNYRNLWALYSKWNQKF